MGRTRATAHSLLDGHQPIHCSSDDHYLRTGASTRRERNCTSPAPCLTLCNAQSTHDFHRRFCSGQTRQDDPRHSGHRKRRRGFDRFTLPLPNLITLLKGIAHASKAIESRHGVAIGCLILRIQDIVQTGEHAPVLIKLIAAV